jgi:VWFA-related protein
MTRPAYAIALTITSILLVSVGVPLLSAQPAAALASRFEPGPEADPVAAPPDSTIKVDVPLVVVSVTVTDEMNRLVTGLSREHFRIEEDKVPQPITQFGAQDTPLSVGLVVDASGSMGPKMSKTREAVAEFLKTRRRDDEFFLVQFNQRPAMVSGFSAPANEIQNRLIHAQSKGRTSLIDAVYLAVSNMRQASNPRKAVLIISDGGDNTSRYTERELARLVKEADVQLYAIGIFEPPSARANTPEELAGPFLLTRLCEITGGRHFTVENRNELPDVVSAIGRMLRNQYVLGYVPENQTKDGKWRRLRVKLDKIKGLGRLHAYFRLGYYAPVR